MKITSSYGMKLTGDSKALENSIRIYRDALHFVIPIVNTHWDEVTDFEYSNQRMMYVEKLVHSTSKSQARYNFDEEFPKFPSYLRRAVLNLALGIVSSYRSKLGKGPERTSTTIEFKSLRLSRLLQKGFI